MFGVIRLLLRFAWLGVMALGIQQVVKMAQEGVEGLAARIEAWETTGLPGVLVRVHEALLKRERAVADPEPAGGRPPDVYGEI